jgi:hypothetical protein
MEFRTHPPRGEPVSSGLDASAKSHILSFGPMGMRDDVSRSVLGAVQTVLAEVIDGPASDAAFLLNRGDAGLLRSLDNLSAAEASALAPEGRASIAAHVDHLCYGLELLIRWNKGEEPFRDANFSASWRRSTVSEAEWAALKGRLRASTRDWLEATKTPRAVSQQALTELIASAAHLAYHLGAIRQIGPATRGPAARD